MQFEPYCRATPRASPESFPYYENKTLYHGSDPGLARTIDRIPGPVCELYSDGSMAATRGVWSFYPVTNVKQSYTGRKVHSQQAMSK